MVWTLNELHFPINIFWVILYIYKCVIVELYETYIGFHEVLK
jgi:hypothetical protein